MGFASIFVDCFAPVFLWASALAFACIVFVVSLLLFVCFACGGCVVGGFLSLRMIATKRKGAPCWCVLSSWVVGLLYPRAVIEKLRCRCFGFFKFVRLVLPTNAARVGRLACSYFDSFGHNVDITYNPSSFLK